MNIYELLILSLALALDAMLVSFSYGLVISSHRMKNSLIMAFFFGFFQFIMPFFSWLITGYVYNYLKTYSKIIVFLIFLMLGVKFIKDAFERNAENKSDCISLWCVFILAVATSIDAFGVGISLRLLEVNIINTCIIIGVITFLLSFSGFHLGAKCICFSKRYALLTGGMLLLYLAFKALIN